MLASIHLDMYKNNTVKVLFILTIVSSAVLSTN